MGALVVSPTPPQHQAAQHYIVIDEAVLLSWYKRDSGRLWVDLLLVHTLTKIGEVGGMFCNLPHPFSVSSKQTCQFYHHHSRGNRTSGTRPPPKLET